MKRVVFPVLIFSLILMSSCATKKDYLVTIHTNYGDMYAVLYDETPKHKENFIKLAEEHFYDSLLFHRVISGFMIQGGDPNSKNAKPGERLGNGGPGYTVPAEFNPKFFHEKGALSAARMGDQVNPSKASSGSQFYVVQGTVVPREQLEIDGNKLGRGLQQLLQKEENKALYDTLAALYQSGDMEAYQKKCLDLRPEIEAELGESIARPVPTEMVEAYSTVGGAPHLDGQYTVFGKVIKGLDIIDKIASQPCDAADRPLQDVRMTVTVEELPIDKIEKEYGYHYPKQEN